MVALGNIVLTPDTGRRTLYCREDLDGRDESLECVGGSDNLKFDSSGTDGLSGFVKSSPGPPVTDAPSNAPTAAPIADPDCATTMEGCSRNPNTGLWTGFSTLSENCADAFAANSNCSGDCLSV